MAKIGYYYYLQPEPPHLPERPGEPGVLPVAPGQRPQRAGHQLPHPCRPPGLALQQPRPQCVGCGGSTDELCATTKL